MSTCQEHFSAEVTAIRGQEAIISLKAPLANNCQQCQQRGGCQSLSIYQWFFASQLPTLPNRQYHLGQQLSLTFPSALLQRSIAALLGIPLLGFLLGAVSSLLIGELLGFFLGITLASLGFYDAKRRVTRHFYQTLGISVQPD